MQKEYQKQQFQNLSTLAGLRESPTCLICQGMKDEWKNILWFGEKSVSNILGSIEACRNCDLESAIAGIGIPLIGRTVAKDLAKRFANYGAFKENIEGEF